MSETNKQCLFCGGDTDFMATITGKVCLSCGDRLQAQGVWALPDDQRNELIAQGYNEAISCLQTGIKCWRDNSGPVAVLAKEIFSSVIVMLQADHPDPEHSMYQETSATQLFKNLLEKLADEDATEGGEQTPAVEADCAPPVYGNKLTEWEERTRKEFPALCPEGEFYMDDGWHPLIYKMLKKIAELNDGTVIGNIKQKYAHLEMSLDPCSAEVQKIIDQAKIEAFNTCEKCGSKEGVEHFDDGWECYLCSVCRAKKTDAKEVD